MPGVLSAAAHGHVHLVGVEPRGTRVVRLLPHDWRALYLRSRPGLITEAFVNAGPWATEDETYTAEAYYTVTRSFGRDLALLLRYLGRVLRSPAGRHQRDAVAAVPD
jgi:uncharacterized heparinase superfamily protein